MPDSLFRDTGPEALLGHQAEGEWHRLRQQLDLSEGFWLGFLFSTSPVVTRAFRQRTENILRFKALTLQAIDPETPNELEKALPRLFEPDPNTGCLWLEAPRVDLPGTAEDEPGSWLRAWDQLMLRLNERRERLRRALQCGLILIAHPRIKPRIRDAAPDLWSIRSIVLEPVPGRLGAPISRRSSDFENPRARERSRRTGRELPSVPPMKHPEKPEPVSEVREPEVGYRDDPREPVPAAARLLRRAAGDLQARDTRDAIDHAVRAIEILDSIQPAEGPDRAGAYALLAQAEMADGDPASAESHFRRAVDLAESPLDRRTLEWLDRLNDIAQARGDLKTAEGLCQEQVRRARESLRQEGESPQALRDLSVSLEKLGEVLHDRGDLQQATDAFQESLLIRRRLLDTYAESPQALRDLSVSLDNLGDVLRDRGDLQQATDAFQESLEIRRRLLDTYGESPQALRDLAIALFNLGRARRSGEASDEARDLLTEAADLERRRAELYGIHAGEPPALLIILRELASLLDKIGDRDSAKKVFQEIEALGQPGVEPNAPSDD